MAKHVTKAEADSAYMRTDYASAIQIYEQLLEYGEAAEIYYNLGNSYYKTGEIAKAILNYERALLLKPNNEDIRVNLEIARGKTVDKVNAIPELFFIAWGKSFINSLGVDSWGILGILSFVLLLVSLCCFIFMKRFLWRRIAFSLSIVLVFVCAWSNLAASQQKKNLLIRNDAIIMLPSVIVRSTPDESGTSLFILHEGRKVSVDVNDSMKEWKEMCVAESFDCPQTLVAGGMSRFLSVRNALAKVPDGAVVAIHDGVRPFVSPELIRRMRAMMSEEVRALIPVVPVVDTLKSLDPSVPDPVRADTVAVQTPQMFLSEDIRKAYGQPYDLSFTDDASVAARAGIPVATTEGERFNIKITTREDLVFGEAILSLRRP